MNSFGRFNTKHAELSAGIRQRSAAAYAGIPDIASMMIEWPIICLWRTREVKGCQRGVAVQQRVHKRQGPVLPNLVVTQLQSQEYQPGHCHHGEEHSNISSSALVFFSNKDEDQHQIMVQWHQSNAVGSIRTSRSNEAP